jgi:hypothetical protein
VYDRSRPLFAVEYTDRRGPEGDPVEECDVPDKLSLDPDDLTGDDAEPDE